MEGEEQAPEINLWSSICSLEQLLSVLTGRPTTLHNGLMSSCVNSLEPRHLSTVLFTGRPVVQQQLTVEEGSPDAETPHTPQPWDCFTASRHLDAIVADVIESLYGSSLAPRSWGQVQLLVSRLDSELDRWQDKLTPGIFVGPGLAPPSPCLLRERVHLSLRLFGTRILIHQISLNDGSEESLALASQLGPEFTARRCISAARSVIGLFPADIDAIEFYRVTPWWCALHYVVQAGVILIRELMFDNPHIARDEMPNLVDEACQAIRLLCTLAPTSRCAHRAWVSLSCLFRLALAKTGRDCDASMTYMADPSISQQPPECPAATMPALPFESTAFSVLPDLASPPPPDLQHPSSLSLSPSSLWRDPTNTTNWAAEKLPGWMTSDCYDSFAADCKSAFTDCDPIRQASSTCGSNSQGWQQMSEHSVTLPKDYWVPAPYL
jgi:hypothetical protein